MATYAIGDVQGCFEPLQRLLAKVKFKPEQDCLWFAGDLVNRGPRSLEVLRFIKGLPHKQVVLGNHDLHLLAVYYGGHSLKKHDTMQDILAAPDCDELLNWLRHQPLLVSSPNQEWCMTHAGLPPFWSVPQATNLSQEVEQFIQSEQAKEFFAVMYGNHPDRWSERLTGLDRLRCIVNYLTRMRFVGQANELDLVSKEGSGTAPAGFKPWFEYPRKSAPSKLLFGHWAALEGITNTPNIYALDTGCVWGSKLTALRLEDSQLFQVNAT
ncbi:MAG: symmetrical bis(5'-nucleosyl)-tetraphosphatase [Venatoribacter sp.]